MEKLHASKAPAFAPVPEMTAVQQIAAGRGLKQRLPRQDRAAVAGGGAVRAFAIMDTGGVHLPLFRLKL
jgi:hypothetical protein